MFFCNTYQLYRTVCFCVCVCIFKMTILMMALPVCLSVCLLIFLCVCLFYKCQIPHYGIMYNNYLMMPNSVYIFTLASTHTHTHTQCVCTAALRVYEVLLFFRVSALPRLCISLTVTRENTFNFNARQVMQLVIYSW